MNERTYTSQEFDAKPKKNLLKTILRATFVGALRPFFEKKEQIDGTAFVSKFKLGGTPIEYLVPSKKNEPNLIIDQKNKN